MTTHYFIKGIKTAMLTGIMALTLDAAAEADRLIVTPDQKYTRIALVGPTIEAQTVPQLPVITGSEEFEVMPPSPEKPTEVSVVAFGAAETNPDNTRAFVDAIDYCQSHKIARLTVPPGTYHFTTDRPINFAGLKDFEFDGGNSVLVFRHTNAHFMEVNQSERIRLKNFSLDWDWDEEPLASFVRVETIEPAGEYLDLRFFDYERFPAPEIKLRGLLELDPKTMSPGVENGFYLSTNGVKYEWREPNLLRIFANDAVESTKREYFKYMKTGGLYRLRHRIEGVASLVAGNSRHLTLQDINVYSVPGPAISCWGDMEYCWIDKVKVTIPPGSKRPISSTSDHLDIHGVQGKFKIENCEFGWGGDDCINLYGPPTGLGVKTGPDEITTSRLFNLTPYAPGIPVELRQDDYAKTGFMEPIAAVKTVDTAKGIHRFTFAKPLPEQTGERFILINKRYQMKNFIIRNTYFHDNQARGMLIHADKVTVDGNRFFHNQLGAIHITTGYTLTDWTEGNGASDIVIRNNQFVEPNPQGAYSQERYAAVKVYAYLKVDPSPEKTMYPLFQNILFDRNHFVNVPGVSVYLTSAENVVFCNNRVTIDRPRQNNLPYRGGFAAVCSSNLYFFDNVFDRGKYSAAPEIAVSDPTVKNIYINHNLFQ